LDRLGADGGKAPCRRARGRSRRRDPACRRVGEGRPHAHIMTMLADVAINAPRRLSPVRTNMLDIKWIRENPEVLDGALRSRNALPMAARLVALDEKRRSHIAKVQTAQERRNAASKEIGRAKG